RARHLETLDGAGSPGSRVDRAVQLTPAPATLRKVPGRRGARQRRSTRASIARPRFGDRPCLAPLAYLQAQARSTPLEAPDAVGSSRARRFAGPQSKPQAGR